MTRIAVLGVLVVIVGALVVSSAGHTLTSRAVQPADDPFLITPGVGIGKVKIGMPIAAVMSIMGNPKNICRGLGEGGKTDMYAWFEGWCTPAPRQPTGASPSNSGGGLVVCTDTKTVTRVEAYKDARYFLKLGRIAGPGPNGRQPGLPRRIGRYNTRPVSCARDKFHPREGERHHIDRRPHARHQIMTVSVAGVVAEATVAPRSVPTINFTTKPG